MSHSGQIHTEIAQIPATLVLLIHVMARGHAHLSQMGQSAELQWAPVISKSNASQGNAPKISLPPLKAYVAPVQEIVTRQKHVTEFLQTALPTCLLSQAQNVDGLWTPATQQNTAQGTVQIAQPTKCNQRVQSVEHSFARATKPLAQQAVLATQIVLVMPTALPQFVRR